jgi:hypothetical protein
MRDSNRLIHLPLLLMLVAAGGCAGTAKVDSHWSDGEIAIDGKTLDWQGKLTAVEDAKMTVGVSNDDDYLYISLVSANREVQQQIAMRRQRGSNAAVREAQIAKQLAATGDAVRLRRSESDEGRELSLSELTGVEAAIVYASPVIIYEIKMPLTSGKPATLALDCDAGDEISLGIEVPALGSPAMRKRGGGGMHGGRGGGRGMPDPIDTWIKIKLMSAETGTER